MDPSVLARKQLPELKAMAADLDMRGYQRLRKADLIEAIVKEANAQADPNQRSGLAEADTDDDVGDDHRRTRSRTRARTDGAPDQRAGQDAAVDTGAAGGGEAGGAEDDDTDGQGDDDGRRRRRNRRERRRTKGPADQQGASGPDGQQRRRTDRQHDDRAGADRSGGDGAGGDRAGSERSGGNRQGGADDGSGAEIREGVLDVLPEGYGFLRTTGYLPGDRDVYVSQSVIRRQGLRRGDVVSGPIRHQKQSEKVPAIAQVQRVGGHDVTGDRSLPPRRDFREMTPLFPQERMRLETPDGPIAMRIVDLMAPVGKGQRGLIVSPPKAGKTTILQQIGQAIVRNHPEVHLMVVLVDERPEEVTDMQRSVEAEIVASTFDRPADDHTQIAELAMERAKRLVEQGRDVVILLDSITRLARAYNLSTPASGRIMSGGVDSSALYPPKRFFGAARNIEEGGSLTIIATALVETGSKMDEVIFEEFKGTGNMELRLDRRLEQKRIFPAIDVGASGTRKEELLLDEDELNVIWKLRRVLHALDGPAALELLIDRMRSTRSNNRFLVRIQNQNLQPH